MARQNWAEGHGEKCTSHKDSGSPTLIPFLAVLVHIRGVKYGGAYDPRGRLEPHAEYSDLPQEAGKAPWDHIPTP